MPKSRESIAAAVLAGVVASHGIYVFATERVEGKVVRTDLTQCDFGSHRWQGFLTLERPNANGESVKIRVVGDTSITKGAEQAYLPALRGV